MPSGLPYFAMYVGDYLADTPHLEAVEHGAYLMLLFHYWQRGRPLPSDRERLRRIARVPESDWPAVVKTIAEFFEDDGNYWKHKRVEVELAKARVKQEQKRAAGERSGEARRTSAERTPSGRLTDAEQTLKRPLNSSSSSSSSSSRGGGNSERPSAPPAGTANGESDQRRRAAVAQEALFDAVFEVCAIDYNCSTQLWSDVTKVVASAHAAGRGPDSIRGQGEWFRANHWRGKRGELPAPRDLLDTAVQFARGITTKGKGNGHVEAKRRILERIDREAKNDS